jgi:transcription antitermination factor NusG
MAGEKKWYVIYTKSRWEKKVHGLLDEKGFENYCPLNKVRKKWSDRIKTVEEPLFKSYVFVKITEEQQTEIRMVNGVLNFVYWVGKPAIVRTNEIEAIKRFLNEYENVQAEPLTLQQDMKVKVLQGAFMDKEATVLKVINNKVYLSVESIGYSLSAFVDKSNVVIVGK